MIAQATVFARFTSRGAADFTGRLLSARRYALGGQAGECAGRLRREAADGCPPVRRAGLLRHHRRPRVQEDLSGAAGDDPPRRPRRAGHWRGERAVDARAVRSAHARDSLDAARRRRRRGVRELGEQLELRRRRLPRPGDLRAPARGARRRRAAAALPGDPAEPVRDGRRGLGDSGLRGRTRASSSRSRSAATSRPRRRSNATLHARLPRGGDLPHRPLPRQGAGAEPALLPLRELVPRADLEPQPRRTACRSRWRRRSASRGAARSTRRPARSATWCRTTCSRCGAARDGAARSARDREALRDEKAQVFKAIRPLDAGATSCAASSAATATRPAWRADSTVETFAALRLHIDSWRWAGVPFYIRAGKRLPVTATEVLVDAASVRRRWSSAIRRPSRRTTCASG